MISENRPITLAELSRKSMRKPEFRKKLTNALIKSGISEEIEKKLRKYKNGSDNNKNSSD